MYNDLENIMIFEDSGFISMESKTSDPEKGTILYDELTELIRDKVYAKRKEIIKYIASYIDRNSEALMISGPYLTPFFNDAKDADPLFTLIDVNKKDVVSIIKKCPLIQTSFRTLNNPFQFLMTATVCVLDEYSQDPYAKECKEMCAMFMAIRFYSSRQHHLWSLGCQKAVMDYTINNLNNKYIFKTEGSVYKVLKHLADGNDETVGVELRKNHLDKFFKYYITNISTKINNTLANIMDEYKKNLQSKKYLNENSDRYDDDNNTIKELNNLSAIILDFTDRVYNSIKSHPIDENILLDATTITKLKVSSVKSTIEEVIDDETTKLKEIINLILQLFFVENPKHTPNKVKSKYFGVFCLNAYKISNSKNTQILRMKEILDDWIRQYGSKYMRLNREATLINFRKSIYIYIVDSIIKFA